MGLRIDGFNHPPSIPEGDSTAGNISMMLLNRSEIETISPVVAYWSAVGGSDFCDDLQASRDQASFGHFYMLIKVTRPMAVSINKEDGLF
ncbi:MAG: hypothetical protein Tsb002_02740 [Wenzhouxiangellaceae bacterium]